MRPVHRTVLGNGLTVLVRQDPSAPVVAIVTRVNAGYFDEADDEVGISHVLEHMYFKGTPSRGVGEIARETKSVGGFLNAHTIYDGTTYEAVLPASRFAAGLAIQADAFANSLLDAGELARELEVIVQEARRKRDAAAALAVESLYALLHDRHRFRRWRIGTEEGLRAITRDRLLAFYRNHYRPRNTILAVVGDVDPDVALAEARRRYGELPDLPVARDAGPEEEGSAGFRFREMAGAVEQAQVVMGWRTPGALHPDTVPLDLAAGILADGRGSRLFRALREARLASHVSAMNYTPRDVGVFVVRSEGDATRAAAAAAAAWAAVRDLARQDPAGTEVTRAKRLFEARWLRRQETMEGQADLLADWEALGGWELAGQYFAAVMALHAGAVRAAVERHLSPDQGSVLVYRPAGTPVFGDDAGALRAGLHAGAAIRFAPAGTARPVPARTRRMRVELERTVGGIAVFRATSGLAVLVRRRPGTPLVHLGAFIPGGAAPKPDALAGIATIMARATVKGTATRDAEAIANESELLGGSIGTAVSADGSAWTLSVPAARHTEAARLLLDVVQRPVFREDAVATESAVAQSQLADLRDDMFRYPVRLAAEAAWGGHPYGRSLLGTEASLQAIGAADVRRWHEQHVLSSGVVLAAVGDVEEACLAAVLAGAAGELQLAPAPAPPEPAWPAQVTVRAEARAKAQSALAIGFPGPRRRDGGRHATELLCGVASGLGGRFFEELREKRSLAYSVHAFAIERVSAGLFLAYVATAPDREEEARDVLLRECRRLATEPVEAGELERAARYAIGSRAITRQAGGAVLGEMVNAWLYGAGLDEVDGVEGALASVTAADILAWAGGALDPARRVEGIVRGGG